MPTEKVFITWKELKQFGFPYSRAHTYRLMKSGSFPPAIKLGGYQGSRVVWKLHDVQTWFEKFETATH